MTKDGALLALDSAQLISSMFTLIPVPVAIVDNHDRVVLSNSCFTEIFGGIARMPAQPQHEIEVIDHGTYKIQTLPLNDHGYRIVFASDVSDQVQLRKQVSHLDKMASIGRVVADVAHELSGPLSDIVSYSKLASASDLGPDSKQTVGIVAAKAERAAHLVQKLLVLAGKAAPRRVPVDLNETVRAAVAERSRRQHHGDFDVMIDLDPNLPKTVGDPSQIEQVVLTLLLNAEGSVAAIENRAGSIKIRTCSRPGQIQLHVSDNGLARQTTRVFEPSENGIGLDICSEIVRDHGGELYAWTSYGGGDTLTLELPVAAQDSESSAGSCLRDKNVLVVDDDANITNFFNDALVRHGARVEFCRSASEAHDRAVKGRFDLVICDLHMPGLSGQSLHRLIEKGASAHRRFLFLTNDVTAAGSRQFFAQNGVNFLRKPFRNREFLDAVDNLFSQNAPRGF